MIGIVEDDGALREALGSILNAADLVVDVFACAERFPASPHRGEIKYLILDVRLPGVSGIELQRCLHDARDLAPGPSKDTRESRTGLHAPIAYMEQASNP